MYALPERAQEKGKNEYVYSQGDGTGGTTKTHTHKQKTSPKLKKTQRLHILLFVAYFPLPPWLHKLVANFEQS